MFSSEIYSIEDIYKYVTDFSNWYNFTNKTDTHKFSDFELPTNHSIEFKLNNTGDIRIACGDSTHTASNGWLYWIYAWYLNAKRIYYRNSSNDEQNSSLTYNYNTSCIFKIEYNGISLKLYVDDTLISTLSCYDTLGLTRLIRITSYSMVSRFDYIKIRQL